MTGNITHSDVLARLSEARADIIRLGVHRLALFGSVRRNGARRDSDIDLLVEFQPGRKSFDSFMALADLLELLLGHNIELVTPESLSPWLRPHILADAVDVIRAA